MTTRLSLALAAVLLLAAAPGIAQVDQPTPAVPSVSTQAIDDARFINVALGFEENFAIFMDSQKAAAESSILTEIASDDFPRATLEAIDQHFPDGRIGLARRFGEVLIGKFREAAPQFLERTAIAYARLITPADLARLRFLMEQRPTEGDVSAADDEAMLQRFAAAAPAVGAEMRAFGAELGASFGVAAFAEVLREMPPQPQTLSTPTPVPGH